MNVIRKPYAPEELRELARDRGPFFTGNARSALLYCADVIEAANKAFEEQRVAVAENGKPPLPA